VGRVRFLFVSTTTYRGSAVQRAVRDDAAAQAFQERMRQGRVCRIAAARAALEIDRKGHVVYEGCASFGEFAQRRGVAPSEAWAILALGHALERWPDLEAEIVEGRVPEAHACRMGTLAKGAAFVRPADEWVAWARGEPEKAFARRVKQRIEEVRARGAPTVEKTFYVSEPGAQAFERARTLASRKAARVLTEGEALEAVSDHYLESFDPLRRKPGARRMPDTSALPDRRDLPAEVARAVMARDGDACAVPFCTNRVFLENSHRVAHAAGGSRERRNLDRICPSHHDLYERGRIRIAGTTESPVFLHADGTPLDARRPCLDPRCGAGPPEAPGEPPPAG
jgi:hypothetical protein